MDAYAQPIIDRYHVYIYLPQLAKINTSSLLASSLTHLVFHSDLKTWLFSKSFPPNFFLTYPTDSKDSRTI